MKASITVKRLAMTAVLAMTLTVAAPPARCNISGLIRATAPEKVDMGRLSVWLGIASFLSSWATMAIPF